MKTVAVLFSVMVALHFASNVSAQGLLDKPVVVTSVEDLDRIHLELRREPKMEMDWDPFDRAVSQIVAYVLVEYDKEASVNDKNHLLEALVSNRTPREIIVLGHLIWLERTRRAFAEADAELLRSRTEHSTEETSSPQLARNMGIANAKVARETINRYLRKQLQDRVEPKESSPSKQ